MRRAMTIGLLVASLSIFAQGQATKNNPGHPEKDEQEKTPPSVALNPISLDFGDQVIRRNSKPRRITVTNTGEKSLYINSAAITDDNRDDFVLHGDTCTGATIAANKSCVIDVIFSPAATGTRRSTLTLTDNAIDSPQRVTLSGSGINSAAVPPSGKP
jgi:hypothetical protein